MSLAIEKKNHLLSYFFIFLFLALFGLWVKGIDIETERQHAGMIIFSLGFLMLVAYVFAQIIKAAKLPLISGYIFAGILAGPYVSGFLDVETVRQFRLIDGLALSFIALNAGGELRIAGLRKQGKSIILNIIFLTLIVFFFILVFMIWGGGYFKVTADLSPHALMVLGILIGVICLARSPASAIAIINECRARGPFTDMVLAVAIAKDVLIIILFTVAIAVSRIIMAGGGGIHLGALSGLVFEIIVSIIIGALIGKGIAFYIKNIGYDFLLFLLFVSFTVSRLSIWLNSFMVERFDLSLHLEPLLICMSAGFFVQNFSRFGSYFIESLERVSLPVYVLFFSLAGASLNLESLAFCWPLALCLVGVRMFGLFAGSWLAGTLSHDPPVFNRNAWMTYITQAGVAIGLAQLAEKQFPEIGVHINTIVLAIIAVSQIIGPITFKLALNNVRESCRR
jgi:Kef-type K+ transport system membrane component KefB